jgi:transcriptional regulator with XRE-family HTH domain
MREARGWSQEKLARAIGLDPTAISKIEKGLKRLRAEEAMKMADALNVDVAALLGTPLPESGIDVPQQPDAPAGFADEAVPYVAGPDDPFAKLQTDNRYLLTVTCDSLDAIGINRGDIVVVDGGKAAHAGLKALQIVRVQYHAPASMAQHSKATTLLRQFVPPALVVTNSMRSNARPVNLDTEDAQIMGVVVSIHRALQA